MQVDMQIKISLSISAADPIYQPFGSGRIWHMVDF